ncbi:MAG: DUF1844 domain-containing protein [Planctomycetota bacterium]
MTDPRKRKRVDDEWKQRAAEEKRKIEQSLAAEENAANAAAAGASGAGLSEVVEGVAGEPRVDFMALIQPLAAQAMAGLGQLPDPRTGMRGIDLEFARDSIDLLSILDVKTRGNLSGEEAAMMQELLQNLRAGFASAARAMAAEATQPPPPAE